VREAGEAVALDGRTSAETYLDTAKILNAARRTGADAVHPGYGFLSENGRFATEITDAGLTWVGPPPAAINSMGDKVVAKRLAQQAGVPILPSSETPDPHAADKIGYPVLIKAAAGGGGKGMRVVDRLEDFDVAVAAAEREALGAFGDKRVFLERYVSRARHIEIQVLGDKAGAVVHLGERECSIQRRHQKVVEEAPSPALSFDTRAAMGAAAVQLAQAVGYHSAGTVEFLYDDETGGFYFLEMNTRLQVEHPVTEAVIGLDLVREMLRIAGGEPLGYTQDDIAVRGWAVEARLYAEDPANDFLPAIGTLHAWRPATQPACRWDSGVEEGSVVGVEFDPMLAKVIAHAPTRSEAALKLALALERSALAGVTTNRDFLVATLRHEAFLAGDTTTDFVARHQPAAQNQPTGRQLETAAVVAALAAQHLTRARARTWAGVRSGWRNSVMPPQERAYTWSGSELRVRYQSRRDGSFAVSIGETQGRATVHGVAGDRIDVAVAGHRANYEVVRSGSTVLVAGPEVAVELVELDRFPERGTEGPSGGLVAPMPGKVLAVHVHAGEAVSGGQLLVVLEAMKMEHHIIAPADGTVTDVRVSAGEQVDNGALLLVLTSTGA
jgi:propionyl-CoA carboxylase alpha chain